MPTPPHAAAELSHQHLLKAGLLLLLLAEVPGAWSLHVQVLVQESFWVAMLLVLPPAAWSKEFKDYCFYGGCYVACHNPRPR